MTYIFDLSMFNVHWYLIYSRTLEEAEGIRNIWIFKNLLPTPYLFTIQYDMKNYYEFKNLAAIDMYSFILNIHYTLSPP